MSGGGGSGEKTEKATPKKIRDARERGQVAQSKELTDITSLLVIILILVINYHNILSIFDDNYTAIFKQIGIGDYNFPVLANFLHQALVSVSEVILFPIVVGAAVSLVANIVQQKGIVFSKEFLQLKFEKLNPIDNAKSIYSLKNLLKFVKHAVECGVLVIVAVYMVERSLSDFFQIYHYGLSSIVYFMCKLFMKVLIVLLCIHFTFAIIDFILEIRHLDKQLMMSHQEIKEEHKNSEGDPEVKGRRKELHRELVEGDGSGEMGYASLVLANPTHVAIVISYKPNRFPLPIILKKAKDYQAQIIFRMARKKGIPIIRHVWLARQLYELAEVLKPAPKSLQSELATVIGKNLDLMPELASELTDVMQRHKTVKQTTAKKPLVFKALA